VGKNNCNLSILLGQEEERWIVGQNLEDRINLLCMLAGWSFCSPVFLLGTELV